MTFSILLDVSTQQPLSSVELDLAYDGTLFAAQNPEAASGWMMAANRTAAGRLRVALATAQPATMAGSVLTLRFSPRANGLDPEVIILSAVVDEIVQPFGVNSQRVLLPLIQLPR